MRKNEYLVAKIGLDTAENEPHTAMNVAKERGPSSRRWNGRGGRPREGAARRRARRGRPRALICSIYVSTANFRGLVLSCIEAKFRSQILILLHFLRSTRLTHFCTAPDSKFQKVFEFYNFRLFEPIFRGSLHNDPKFATTKKCEILIWERCKSVSIL